MIILSTVQISRMQNYANKKFRAKYLVEPKKVRKISMVFDFCISNPAFNIAKENNVAGTGGNTTLYKKATRNDFDLRVAQNGTLVNITLKGIISDLVSGYFSKYQVDNINLMDGIDIWPYNTCFFSIRKSQRISLPNISGGMAAKIFSPFKEDCFPFFYYSGNDNGMNKLFGADKKNKVIRRLPGKKSNTVTYDFTDKELDHKPKFAFSVLESPKSYTVTEEPIFGGTICYVPTDSIEQAEKIKLFVQKNEIFKEYIRRMKIRGHAFGLRYVRKFDLNQIETGKEIPREWGLIDSDFLPPQKLVNEIEKNIQRAKDVGEIFTPSTLVMIVLDFVEESESQAFKDPTKTFLDSMCGDGQFLVEILKRKVTNGIPIEQALSTIYGTELLPDNVKLCQDRLLCGQEHLRHIVERNIVCHDALTYDYSFNGTSFTDAEISVN